MKKLLKKFGRELLCLLCVAILSVVVVLWARLDGVKNPSVGSLLLLVGGIDGFVLIHTFRRLWREKFKRVLIGATQVLFERLIRGLTFVAEKMGFSKKRGNVIGGRTSILFDRISFEREAKRPTVRKLRWKQLKDDPRAQMGYLYANMIKRRLAAGSEYYGSDTPLQLQAREENTPIEDELFALYIQKRYDARTEPDEETLLRIKDEMQIK